METVLHCPIQNRDNVRWFYRYDPETECVVEVNRRVVLDRGLTVDTRSTIFSCGPIILSLTTNLPRVVSELRGRPFEWISRYHSTTVDDSLLNGGWRRSIFRLHRESGSLYTLVGSLPLSTFTIVCPHLLEGRRKRETPRVTKDSGLRRERCFYFSYLRLNSSWWWGGR